MAGKKRKYTIIVEDVDDENVAEEPRHSSTATTTIAADTTPSSAAVEHTDPIVEELAQVRRLVDAIEARESRQVSQNATAGTSTATAEQAIADIKPVVEEFEHDVGDSDCIITEVRQVRRSNRQAVKRLKQFKQEEINQEHRASTPSQPQPVSVTAATPAQKNPTAPAFESGIETISGHENGVTATPPVAIESKTDRSKRRAKRLQSLMLATAESIAGDPATDNATSSPSSPSATVTSHLVQEDDAQNDTDNSSDEESGWETMSDSDEQHAAERTITYLTNYKRLPASALANRAHIIFDKGNTSSSNYNIPDSEKWLPDIIVSAIKMYSVRALNHFLSRNFKKFWFSCLMFITDHKRLSYSISRDNDIVEVAFHDAMLTPKNPTDLQWTRDNIKHNFIVSIRMQFTGATSAWQLKQYSRHRLNLPQITGIGPWPPRDAPLEQLARFFYDYIRQQTFEEDNFQSLKAAWGDRLVFDVHENCVLGQVVSPQSGVIGYVDPTT